MISRTKIGIDCLELLLYAGLIIATAAALCENLGNRSVTTIAHVSPGNVLPTHYDIQLRVPHPAKRNVDFYGSSGISLYVRCATRSIGLHSLGTVIDETKTELIKIKAKTRSYYPISHVYDAGKHIVAITFGEELKPGSYKLHVKFTGVAPKLYEYELVHFYRQSYRSIENIVLIARMPFMPVAIYEDSPCWDQSQSNTTFTVAVIHNSRYTALSYDKPERVSFIKERDMMCTHFPESPSMSTCAVVVVVLDFVHISNRKETVNLWCRPHLKAHLKFAHGVAQNITQHLKQYLRHFHKKIDHVAVPKFALLESAYWGVNIYNEQDIVYNKETHPTFRMMDVAKKIATQVAHQWFGVTISPICWSNMWLSQGLASFFHTYILDKIFEKWRQMDFLVVKDLQESFRTDSVNLLGQSCSKSSAVRNPYNYYFNPAIYKKAPIVLRILQHIMTDEVFREGIITYLHYHTFAPVTFDNLWNVMQLVLSKSNVLHRNFKIKEVMDSWVNYKQYPLVTVTRNYETGETIISQKRFHLQKNEENDVTEDHKWWIPVTFATQTNPDFSNTFPNYWLSPLDQNISLHVHPNDWIVVNLQQVESKAFKLHMAKIFTGLLENVGYEEKLDEDDLMKLKRLDATKWACIVGNSKCRRMATVKLDEYLANPDRKISPWWQKWVYCSGLMAANITTWNRVMDLYLQKPDRKFLEYLACSEDPDVIINYLNIIASKNLITIDIDRDLALTCILNRHASNNLVLDYVLENFEQMESKFITANIILRNLISNVYSKELLHKIKEFMKCNLGEQSKISIKVQRLIHERLIELKVMKADFKFLFINKDQV
ncbi:PREDICTED: leucyl-cystinyl aminopeptidase-like isoform X2 [Vollenhovia emeryi]|uniref:leucyl-cystinyl aminopeptidase-like isoform X2 n=1 Tax=Vollenhovia emeryi TaxID=411798 RepID=UPI0005F44ADD|nr:PREDICTED: leucyl-cystinyl aminopeptidase-like isoform X2 [Vollenhovia emeryi]